MWDTVNDIAVGALENIAMKKFMPTVLLLLSPALGVSAQEKAEIPSENIQTVDYCVLRKSPGLYNGKTIRVSGIYESGFEQSAFYSKACIDDAYRGTHETWVDNFYGAKISSGKEIAEVRKTFLSGTAGHELDATFTGVFRGSKVHGGFGHLNSYDFLLEVISIEEARLFPTDIAGCKRIDPTKPFHYLSYEKSEKGISPSFEKSKEPKSENLIYIRLANNTTCSTKVPTINSPDSSELKDRSEVPVVYSLSSQCTNVSSRSITKLIPTFSVLSPGNSIYFTVPLRFLTKEPYLIQIPFDSQSDKFPRYYQPFYFSRYDLPENLRKDMDCRKY